MVRKTLTPAMLALVAERLRVLAEPARLQILNQLDRTNWPLLMAAAVVMTAPVILMFVILQRFFLHDLSLSNLFEKN